MDFTLAALQLPVVVMLLWFYRQEKKEDMKNEKIKNLMNEKLKRLDEKAKTMCDHDASLRGVIARELLLTNSILIEILSGIKRI